MFERTRRSAKETLLKSKPGLFWWYVRMRHGFLEPEMELLPKLCMRDRISIDVGANFGVYSYYMAKYSRACVAFEPFPHLADLLRKGLGHRIQVHQVALSDRSGVTQMLASLKQPGHNTIEPSNQIEHKVDDPTSIVTLEVPVQRLDDFDLEPVGFIKIDVEGHELEVLAGATSTLTKYLPTLVIEVEERHRSGSTSEVVRRLDALGYHGFYLQSGMLKPAATFDRARDQDPQTYPSGYIRNFVFIPEHRLISFMSDIEGSAHGV